jgi:hypothetical protein
MKECVSVKPARLSLALLIGAAVALMSCVEPTPIGPDRHGPALEASVGSSSGGMLYCRPQAYDSVTQWITGNGGTFRVGHHDVSIPAGALSGPVSITAIAPSDTVNRILFRPDGLVFKKPVTLTMSYANCNMDKSALWIAYTNDSLAILEYEPSIIDVVGNKVTAALSHFSSYAVSY